MLPDLWKAMMKKWKLQNIDEEEFLTSVSKNNCIKNDSSRGVYKKEKKNYSTSKQSFLVSIID